LTTFEAGSFSSNHINDVIINQTKHQKCIDVPEVVVLTGLEIKSRVLLGLVHLKTHLILSVLAFQPHWDGVFINENEAFWKRCPKISQSWRSAI